MSRSPSGLSLPSAPVFNSADHRSTSPNLPPPRSLDEPGANTPAMTTRKRTRRKAPRKPAAKQRVTRAAAPSSLARAVTSSEIDALRHSIEKRRWNADAEDVQRSVAQLVL